MNLFDLPSHTTLPEPLAINLVGIARGAARPSAHPVPRPPPWAPPLHPRGAAERLGVGRPRAVGGVPAYLSDSSTLLSHERRFFDSIGTRRRDGCGMCATGQPHDGAPGPRPPFVGGGANGGSIPRAASCGLRPRNPGAAAACGGVAAPALTSEEAAFVYRYAAYRTAKRLRRAMHLPVDVRRVHLPPPGPAAAPPVEPPAAAADEDRSSLAASAQSGGRGGGRRHCTRCARSLCGDCGCRAHSDAGSAVSRSTRASSAAASQPSHRS